MAADAAAAIAYLDERELVTHVYHHRVVPITIGAALIDAVTYVADPGHEQHAGTLPAAEAAHVIRNGKRGSGNNPDYLRNVVEHLDDLGIAGGPLHALLRTVDNGADAP